MQFPEDVGKLTTKIFAEDLLTLVVIGIDILMNMTNMRSSRTLSSKL